MSAALMKGPWTCTPACEADGSVTFDISSGSRDVAYVQTYAGQPLAEQEAIARMATAAPRMFAALIAAQAYVPPSSPVHQQIGAAIAQARGTP